MPSCSMALLSSDVCGCGMERERESKVHEPADHQQQTHDSKVGGRKYVVRQLKSGADISEHQQHPQAAAANDCKRTQHSGSRIGKQAKPTTLDLTGVIEENTRKGAHVETVQTQHKKSESQEHPVQRKSDGPNS